MAPQGHNYTFQEVRFCGVTEVLDELATQKAPVTGELPSKEKNLPCPLRRLKIIVNPVLQTGIMPPGMRTIEMTPP